MAKQRQDEEQFKARVMGNAQWKAAYGGAWEAIAEAEKKAATRYREQLFRSVNSQFATVAMNLVQYVPKSRSRMASGSRAITSRNWTR